MTSACSSCNSASVSEGVSLVFMGPIVRFTLVRATLVRPTFSFALLSDRSSLCCCNTCTPYSGFGSRLAFYRPRFALGIAKCQNSADVEQNNQPSLVLAEAGHAIQPALLHHGGRSFDFAFRNLQNF